MLNSPKTQKQNFSKMIKNLVYIAMTDCMNIQFRALRAATSFRRSVPCMYVCFFMLVGIVLSSLLSGYGESEAVAQENVDNAPARIFETAVNLFFDGKPDASVSAFDQLIAVQPACQPDLWQRGLALYYADRFVDGQKQFELHRTVNPNDVENPVWHYLCVARATSPKNARRHMLAVGNDSRVPMKEILELYRGDGSEENVLEHASQGSNQQKRNQLCYAHLYLGLYAESNGNMEKAKEHILEAAGVYSMDHYMGRVANVHARIRGWLPPLGAVR